jgi:hypothetical protein
LTASATISHRETTRRKPGDRSVSGFNVRAF